MMDNTKQISIAALGISLISDIPITLSERASFFEASSARSDVTMHFHYDCQELASMLSSTTKVYEEERYDIFCTNDITREISYYKVQYDAPKKSRIVWIATSNLDCTCYHIYFASDAKPYYVDGINPLQYVILSDFLMHHQAIILHSSLIDYCGNGIAFTAPSQTGKSTQARLWETYKNAEIVNGDRAIIRRIGSDYYGCGSPFAGSSSIYKNKSIPMKALVVLKQAPENRIRRMQAKEAFLHLLSEISVLNVSKELVHAQTDWLLQCIATVPVYLLECRPDQEAVELLFDTITNQN